MSNNPNNQATDKSSSRVGSASSSSKSESPLWTKDFIMITVMNFVLFCGFQAFPSTLPLYVKELGGSDVILGWISGINTLSALLIRPFGGMIIDRFGRKGILLVSLVIMIVASFSYAFFPYVALVLFIRFIHGLGWGTASTATSTIATDVIPRKRFGEGMGYFSLSGSLAMAVAPGVSIMLFYALGMEAVSYVATGILILAFIMSFFLNYDTLPKKEVPAQKRADTVIVLENAADLNSASSDLEKREPTSIISKRVAQLFEKTALFPSFLIMFLTAAYGAVITFVAVYASSLGITDIGIFFTVYAVVLLITRPFFGRMVDSKGAQLVVVLGFVCAAASLAALAFSSELWMFLVAGALFGIAFGSSMSGLQTMAVANASADRRGSANATYFVGFDGGLGLGSVVSGLVVTAFGYSAMYLVFAALPLLAIILFFVHKRVAKPTS